ncbi:hypothetical protein DPMN_053624 [Dreissena polymorpha]|uniref:Uncharacterized protein n=1 Tax=Dreissena polymorpha TaxID=45954 RepID=A0A9D4CMG3_DREPO|nr:hypothetical protein DPMN_053624 [Dreissena polymorpha]
MPKTESNGTAKVTLRYRHTEDASGQARVFIRLRNKYEALADADADSLEKKWDQVKNTFTSVCEERLGFRTHTHKTLISELSIRLKKKTRAIRLRLLQAKTREQS